MEPQENQISNTGQTSDKTVKHEISWLMHLCLMCVKDGMLVAFLP